jgi:hypothetical protein
MGLAAVPAIAPVTTIAAAITVATAAFAGRAIFPGPGNIYCQGASLEFLAMEHFDRLGGIGGVRVFDERKAAGFAREFVEHQVDRTYHPGLREIILQVILHRLIRKISNKKSGLAHRSIAAQKTEWGNPALAVFLNVCPLRNRHLPFIATDRMFFALTEATLSKFQKPVNTIRGAPRRSLVALCHAIKPSAVIGPAAGPPQPGWFVLPDHPARVTRL